MNEPLRQKILVEAVNLTYNERNEAHGDPTKNHDNIALIWSGILGQPITATQVALCMAGVKLARAGYNPKLMDSYIDGAAYFAIAGEVEHADRQINNNKQLSKEKRTS
jgi:hypothetical protein